MLVAKLDPVNTEAKPLIPALHCQNQLHEVSPAGLSCVPCSRVEPAPVPAMAAFHRSGQGARSIPEGGTAPKELVSGSASTPVLRGTSTKTADPCHQRLRCRLAPSHCWRPQSCSPFCEGGAYGPARFIQLSICFNGCSGWWNMTDDGNYSTAGSFVFFYFLKKRYRHPKHFKQL